MPETTTPALDTPEVVLEIFTEYTNKLYTYRKIIADIKSDHPSKAELLSLLAPGGGHPVIRWEKFEDSKNKLLREGASRFNTKGFWWRPKNFGGDFIVYKALENNLNPTFNDASIHFSRTQYNEITPKILATDKDYEEALHVQPESAIADLKWRLNDLRENDYDPKQRKELLNSLLLRLHVIRNRLEIVVYHDRLLELYKENPEVTASYFYNYYQNPIRYERDSVQDFIEMRMLAHFFLEKFLRSFYNPFEMEYLLLVLSLINEEDPRYIPSERSKLAKDGMFSIICSKSAFLTFSRIALMERLRELGQSEEEFKSYLALKKRLETDFKSITTTPLISLAELYCARSKNNHPQKMHPLLKEVIFLSLEYLLKKSYSDLNGFMWSLNGPGSQAINSMLQMLHEEENPPHPTDWLQEISPKFKADLWSITNYRGAISVLNDESKTVPSVLEASEKYVRRLIISQFSYKETAEPLIEKITEHYVNYINKIPSLEYIGEEGLAWIYYRLHETENDELINAIKHSIEKAKSQDEKLTEHIVQQPNIPSPLLRNNLWNSNMSPQEGPGGKRTPDSMRKRKIEETRNIFQIFHPEDKNTKMRAEDGINFNYSG